MEHSPIPIPRSPAININRSSSSPSPLFSPSGASPSSASSTSSSHPDNPFFSKRGVKRSSNDASMQSLLAKMDEELQKGLPQPPESAKKDETDDFLAFVGSRLRNLTPEQRKRTENDIVMILLRTDS